METTTITFLNGNQARAVYSSPEAGAADLITALELPPSRAVLLVHGGAARLPDGARYHLLQELLYGAMVRIATDENLTIVDGGTLSGVMQMIGEGYAAARASSPLIGVCPAGRVTWPGKENGSDLTPLEPHHTHFVLTPGDAWGSETETFFALAAALARGVSSVALIINGGAVSRQEFRCNVLQGREVLALAGSGRFADTLASVVQGTLSPPDAELLNLARTGKVTVLDVNDGFAALANNLLARLLPGATTHF